MSSAVVELVPVTEREKGLVRSLMQAYRHDLSEFDGSSPDASGLFDVGSYFDLYWTEPTRYPLKALVGGVVAGFVLVREVAPGIHSIAEFFVLRCYRRRGIGRAIACQVFDRFPGTWHVAQDEANAPAQEFWREVIRGYTKGVYEEGWSDAQPRGPQQIFRTQADSQSAASHAGARRGQEEPRASAPRG